LVSHARRQDFVFAGAEPQNAETASLGVTKTVSVTQNLDKKDKQFLLSICPNSFEGITTKVICTFPWP